MLVSVVGMVGAVMGAEEVDAVSVRSSRLSVAGNRFSPSETAS